MIWRRAPFAQEAPHSAPEGATNAPSADNNAIVSPSGDDRGAISQRPRLYVVVKNREKRVTGGRRQ